MIGLRILHSRLVSKSASNDSLRHSSMINFYVKIKLKLKHYLLHIDGEIDHFLIRLSPNDKG